MHTDQLPELCARVVRGETILTDRLSVGPYGEATGWEGYAVFRDPHGELVLRTGDPFDACLCFVTLAAGLPWRGAAWHAEGAEDDERRGGFGEAAKGWMRAGAVATDPAQAAAFSRRASLCRVAQRHVHWAPLRGCRCPSCAAAPE